MLANHPCVSHGVQNIFHHATQFSASNGKYSVVYDSYT